jgi:hypothetical protein
MADPRTLPATAPVVGRRPSGWRAPGLPGAEVCFRVAEGPSLYRPRYPERTPLWKLFDEHYLDFTRVHEERFEHEDGPLRTVVTETVTAFLDCGVLRAGFARVCCPECHAEYLLAFSCKGRGLCPSCQAKRAELFAEKLREEILAPLAHRHVVFTIPKALRKLFLRERALLDLLPRVAFETLTRCLRAALDRKDGVPGFVVAIQTFGTEANYHPHLHGLVSDGLFLRGGEFVGAPLWDEEFERLLTETFRRLVLAALRKRDRLSDDFHEKLLTWRHGGGFSVYGRHLILNAEPA